MLRKLDYVTLLAYRKEMWLAKRKPLSTEMDNWESFNTLKKPTASVLSMVSMLHWVTHCESLPDTQSLHPSCSPFCDHLIPTSSFPVPEPALIGKEGFYAALAECSEPRVSVSLLLVKFWPYLSFPFLIGLITVYAILLMTQIWEVSVQFRIILDKMLQAT